MRGKALLHCTVQTWRGITPAYAGKSYSLALFLGLHRDHPRVCGEKVLKDIKKAAAVGSPPRMRGKALEVSTWLVLPRITPAYAGKSGASVGRLAVVRDHPRVCGEKRPVRRGACSGLGSPPRMRGKDLHREERARCGGITPAYAGKSPNWFCSRLSGRDHPRVCGEKFFVVLVRLFGPGSPPRMRGKD